MTYILIYSRMKNKYYMVYKYINICMYVFMYVCIWVYLGGDGNKFMNICMCVCPSITLEK